MKNSNRAARQFNGKSVENNFIGYQAKWQFFFLLETFGCREEFEVETTRLTIFRENFSVSSRQCRRIFSKDFSMKTLKGLRKIPTFESSDAG